MSKRVKNLLAILVIIASLLAVKVVYDQQNALISQMARDAGAQLANPAR